MIFNKSPTSIDKQLDLLRTRGMQIDNADHARNCLESIGYYRLSAYWLPFEQQPILPATRSKLFHSGTCFQKVYDLYVFDRRLRVLLLEAIERIEIHVRSRWTYRMVHAHGAHAHLDHKLFSGGLNHAEQLHRLARSVEKSEETFIHHFKKKYSSPYSPPLWAATELMTLGELSKWFQATKDHSLKSAIGHDLGLPTREVCESVLQNLSYVRNICAHHGRLWNRRLVKRLPWIKRYKKDIILEEMGDKNQPANSIYNIMVVLLHMLHLQNTDTTFRVRLQELVESVTDSDRTAMGFPEDWRARPAFLL